MVEVLLDVFRGGGSAVVGKTAGGGGEEGDGTTVCGCESVAGTFVIAEGVVGADGGSGRHFFFFVFSVFLFRPWVDFFFGLSTSVKVWCCFGG